MRRWLAWIWAEAVYAVTSLGYLIRPYDTLADCRRWWWQPRQLCGQQLLGRRTASRQPIPSVLNKEN